MTDEIKQVLQMVGLGALGGIVRICGDGSITTWRMMVASVLVSAFGAGVTAALLHNSITDPVYLGAICGVGGYMGQTTIVLLEKRVRKIVEAAMGKA
jgi:hypothetical protein